MLERFLPFLGILVWCFLAFLVSNHKSKIAWKIIVRGLGLQLVLTVLVLGIPILGIKGPFNQLFVYANDGVNAILSYSNEGSKFIFGNLMNVEQYGFIFAFQVLPTIIFMSAVMSILYYMGLMQIIVGFFAMIMHKTFRASGAESLSTAGNIFLGQTEAPLIIKPYLNKMTQSELFCVMVGGMASVAGGVLAAYVGLLNQKIPNIAGHLMIASILSAPATLIISKIIYPEVDTPVTLGKVPTDAAPRTSTNIIDAAASGASEGLSLALNVAAMLLAFIALIAMLNGVLGLFGLSFQQIMGWVFAPFTLFLGIPWSEAFNAGTLLGEKTVLNEFVAYLSLSQKSAEFSDRTNVILSYALCGFANFSSIAIQIGGIGGLAPQRREDLAALGLKCVFGGTLCSFLIASVVATLI
jgi:CNT family concentrative nucleoside transporter